MRIEEIDKNFQSQQVQMENKIGYVIPHESFSLYGIFYDADNECFTRMPFSVAEKVSEGVRVLSRNTAGGRLCFATDSGSIQISVTYAFLCNMVHMPLTGSSGFSLFKKTEDGELFIKNLVPTPTNAHGFVGEIALQGGEMQEYILYFPLYNDVKSLTVALDKTARVEKCNPYRNIKPILYYGSSITQGGCANRADHSYQSMICKKNYIDYINLGFSGNARAEDLMVDYLASVDCSLFVCDYDHNAPTAEYLQSTHFRLYERYRAKRPDTPILFLTKPDWARDADGELRIKIVRSTYQKAKKLGDQKVYFLSGKNFYKGEDPSKYAVDGCHPTDFGFYRMAEEIYKKMVKIDEQYR